MMEARMRVFAALLTLSAVALGGGWSPVAAWNDTGHEVVALIAWENLSPATRSKVVSIMRQAPAASKLRQLFREDGRPLDVREREFFRRAATWPDLARDLPDFHHSTWHHRNFYWKQENGVAVDLPDLQVNPQNVVERLEHWKTRLADPSVPPAQRAIEFAWVLHLVGDIHQPLHCSGRVTASEPDGDRGGNTFLLAILPGHNPDRDRQTLHAYWDGMIDKAFRRRAGETHSAYLQRAASLIVARHPRALLEAQLKPGQIEVWARESVVAAQAAYPRTLERKKEPAGDYRLMGIQVSRERVALGGYRLALMLEQLTGP
jgi:S1/P1 Nuclease